MLGGRHEQRLAVGEAAVGETPNPRGGCEGWCRPTADRSHIEDAKVPLASRLGAAVREEAVVGGGGEPVDRRRLVGCHRGRVDQQPGHDIGVARAAGHHHGLLAVALPRSARNRRSAGGRREPGFHPRCNPRNRSCSTAREGRASSTALVLAFWGPSTPPPRPSPRLRATGTDRRPQPHAMSRRHRRRGSAEQGG